MESSIYSKEQLLEMYYNLKRSRIFVLKMAEAVFSGLIRSSFHTPYGQEAIAVGISTSMRKTDWLAATHRLQCSLIMRYDVTKFIAELFGLRDGLKHGSCFDYHLCDYREDGPRILAGLGTLGGTIPMNTGFAWARKRQGYDDVIVIVHGDGGCSEGAAYEGWNLAALYKTPTVFVIENNKWAMTVPLCRESANPVISEKAGSCGLSTQVVNGNDMLAVRRAMDIAMEKARKGEPNVVEMNTLRWDAHYVGQGNDYRDDKEIIADSMANDDCVKNYEKFLVDNGYIDQKYIDDLAALIEKEMDTAIATAAKSEKPRYDDIYRKEYIYANPETGGAL